jgi:hypothetical protein
MDAERISEYIVLIAFYLIVIAVVYTWVVMVIQHPRSRFEWASLALITSFLLILVRSLYVLATGGLIPQPYGAIFWLINLALVAFYVWTLAGEWTMPLIREVCAFCVTHKYVMLVALVILAAILGHWTFHWF